MHVAHVGAGPEVWGRVCGFIKMLLLASLRGQFLRQQSSGVWERVHDRLQLVAVSDILPSIFLCSYSYTFKGSKKTRRTIELVHTSSTKFCTVQEFPAMVWLDYLLISQEVSVSVEEDGSVIST